MKGKEKEDAFRRTLKKVLVPKRRSSCEGSEVSKRPTDDPEKGRKKRGSIAAEEVPYLKGIPNTEEPKTSTAHKI